MPAYRRYEIEVAVKPDERDRPVGDGRQVLRDIPDIYPAATLVKGAVPDPVRAAIHLMSNSALRGKLKPKSAGLHLWRGRLPDPHRPRAGELGQPQHHRAGTGLYQPPLE